jgi:hypothetical protein
MSANEKKRCDTKLLDDLPATSDAFASDGDTGPHQRVANAIADLIESAEVGGKAIGLEGGWGSGKSTVVRFLSDRFFKNDDYTVVLFDAWAHEGDPLRRTFIESIVTELSEYGWADKDAWKKKLEELANRRKKTQTLITPHATPLGTLAAVSLLLIPLGIALTNAGLRQGVTLEFGRPVNWLFTLGLLLVLCPFWVLLVRTIRVLFKERRAPRLSDYAFITNEAVSETHTETIETPEPTSLEFDDYFRTLMAETLSKTSRRLLLVLDNLDRVDAETARSIWGTLQTFLHDRDHESEAWYKQVWVVVPYDPIRIRKLWNQPEEQKLTDADERTPAEEGEQDKGPGDTTRTTESFLDKSFQVRFHVAPPVLSDWMSFLYELVKESLPGHIEDRHMIYRVFDHCRARGGDPPTPRELKLYVNQIGAVHRQWQHTFPIGHIAFFVLARKAHHRLIDELREGALPTQDDCRLLDDETHDHDLKSSLAGLAFNVKASKGLELLLADSIWDAFKDPEPDELKKIAARNGAGFWAVLETLATTRWREVDARGITQIASQLRASKLLESYDGPEKAVVLSALYGVATNMKTWMPVSDELGDGIGNLLTIQSDQEFSTTILKKFFTQLANVDSSKESDTDAATVVRTIIRLFDIAKSLGHTDSIPKTVTLPFKAEHWIAACSDIATHDNEQNYWGRLKPSGKPEEVSISLVSKISSGEFSEPDVAALEVTHKSAAKCEWKDVCTAIQSRLDAGQNAPVDECAHLLSALFQLESLEVEAASSAQKSLSEPGHLLHHFHRAKSQNEYTTQAAVIFSFAGQRPNLTKPTAVGDSDAGYPSLVAAVDSPEEEVTTALYDLAKRHELLPDILWVIQNADKAHEIFVEVLKLVADSESPEIVFTSEVVAEHWSSLRRLLNDESQTLRFQNLVGELSQSNGLCDFLQGSEDEFEPEVSMLYLDILRGAEGSVPDFVEWCRDGVQRMSKEDWKADLTGNNANCAVCIELSRQKQPPHLTNNFTDALQSHARSVIQGNDIPADWIVDAWSTVIDCIEESSGTRKVLRERLVDTAISADGKINDRFFDMYGVEIADSSILAAHDRVLSHLFTPLVGETHERGLAWLAEFAQENPDFIEEVEAEHTAQDFTNRLQGLVDDPAEHETQVTIESIAAHFGIEPTPKAEEYDDSESNEEGQAAETREEEC